MKWNLHNLRGPIETVKASVAADTSIPTSMKDAIAAQVEELKALGASGVRLDTYCQDNHNKGEMTLTRNIQITLVGVML